MKTRQGDYEYWMEVPVRVAYTWFPASPQRGPYIEIDNIIVPNNKVLNECLEKEKEELNKQLLEENEE